MKTGPAIAAGPVVCLAAVLAISSLHVDGAAHALGAGGAAGEPEPRAVDSPGVPAPPETASFAARRLTPADQDAVRPVFNADATRIAYVRVPAPAIASAPAAAEPALKVGEGAGEEIWILDVASGAARRLVGRGDLSKAGLTAPRYTLLDLAWSPAGDRLAFTWFDGGGWGQIAFADPNGEVLPLPAPVMADRWEGGALYDLSASQFLWDASGRSGTFVAWDEDCGSLYRVAVPPAGSWPGLPVRAAGGRSGGKEGAGREEEPSKPADAVEGPESVPAAGELLATPQPLPLARGCRPFLLGAPGFWLYSEFDEGFSQRLVVADDRGTELEEITFPQGRPLRVRWGPEKALGRIVSAAPPVSDAAAPAAAAPVATSSRPPVAGWWYDVDRHERTLFTWVPGGMREWRREPCPSDCGDPLAMTERALLTLEGPTASARLVAASAPFEPPREVLPAPVEDVIAAPDGASLLAVRVEEGRRSIWILDRR